MASSPDERQKKKKKKKKKSNFNYYINPLFLDHFCVLIVKCRGHLCKIRGVKMLLSNVFGFWTHSLEMDEWSGFSWLKPGM